MKNYHCVLLQTPRSDPATRSYHGRMVVGAAIQQKCALYFFNDVSMIALPNFRSIGLDVDQLPSRKALDLENLLRRLPATRNLKIIQNSSKLLKITTHGLANCSSKGRETSYRTLDHHHVRQVPPFSLAHFGGKMGCP